MELILRVDTAWVREQDSKAYLQTIQDTLSKVFYDVDLRFTTSEGVAPDGYKYLYMVIEVEGQHAKSMHTQICVLDKIQACIHMYVCTSGCVRQTQHIEVFNVEKSVWQRFSI